jgi:hypothetical protein
VRSLYSRRTFPTIDGVRNTLRILERFDPKFGRLKAENLVPNRIVRKLEQDGVFNWSLTRFFDDQTSSRVKEILSQ